MNRTEHPAPWLPGFSRRVAASRQEPERGLEDTALSPAPPLPGWSCRAFSWGWEPGLSPEVPDLPTPFRLPVSLPILPEGPPLPLPSAPPSPLALPVSLASAASASFWGMPPEDGQALPPLRVQSTCPRLVCPVAPLRTVYEPFARGAHHWTPGRSPSKQVISVDATRPA